MLLSERVQSQLFENKDTKGIGPAKCCHNCMAWGGEQGSRGLGPCKFWTINTQYPVLTKLTDGCKKFEMRK